MRASMAFPGLFSPVELEGRLLVDGGVAENFPVETARKAGAEVLVAVNIGTPPAGKEKLTSLVEDHQPGDERRDRAEREGVEGRQSGRRTSSSSRTSATSRSSTSSGSATRWRRARRRRALQIEELRKFSVPEAEYRAWRERTRRKPYVPFQISSIELVNPSPVSNEIDPVAHEDEARDRST